jgi:hypothetical protein
MTSRKRTIGGIVLVALSTVWLLRGLIYSLTLTGPELGGAVFGMVIAAMLLTVGIVLLVRRRQPS